MVYVVSGYWSCFHQGHKEYVKSVIGLMNKQDRLIVIVANPLQFQQKYVDFIPPIWKICEPIYDYLDTFDIDYTVKVALDRDMTVRETLRKIVKDNPNDSVIFCKDGQEYNKENLPEKDIKGISFAFMDNPKIANASEILNIKKR